MPGMSPGNAKEALRGTAGRWRFFRSLFLDFSLTIRVLRRQGTTTLFVAGKAAQLRIPTSVACEACSGTGAKTGTKPKPCPTCAGAGRIRHAQGFFTLERTCPACQGRGHVIDSPCPTCSGAGRVSSRTSPSIVPNGA